MTSTALGRLEILREKNERFDFVNHDVYRLLYREDLYVMAYERIKSNAGYMTKGTDGTTLDSFSMRNVKSVISSLRDESYQPNPTRRVLIPKKNGKQRPLGIPSTTDKILQYVVKMILDSIYDSPNNPTFLECSHGFREGRSCHSALKEISNWNGTKWLIEGDIKGFFDNIDHKVLTNILKRRIDDDRFISLIHKFLNAGYVWKGTEYSTEVGTPQGGVISPVLANVYLHEFDIWINGISEKLTKGKKRGPNPEYRSVTRKRSYLLNKLEKAGLKPSLDDLALLNQYEKRMRELPSLDMNDPEFIRVRYVRYADDWLIGLVGDKTLANELKSRCTQFFREVLKLELSEEKTKITHNSDKAEFLGFYITTQRYNNQRLSTFKAEGDKRYTKRRIGNESSIRFEIPKQGVMNKLVTDGYIKVKKDGKTYWPISLGQLTALDDDDIVLRYNAVKRGLFNYYMPADNRSQVLGYVDMLLRFSLAKTLAHKHRTTMRAQFQKRGRSLRVTKEVNGINREYNFWECSLAKPKDGGFRHSDRNPLDLIQSWVKVTKSSLLHDECAICGSDDRLQMHHLRHLRKGNKDITKGFNRLLSAVNRKQMCVCHGCHWKIHNGDYDGLALKDLHASGKYL